MRSIFALIMLVILVGCGAVPGAETPPIQDTGTVREAIPDHTDEQVSDTINVPGNIQTGMISREELIAFARTQLGVPYRYASTDPAVGFDCSGFITYVFNHFNIKVPRSSVDFTNEGIPVDTADAQPGDLILFTGTDSTDRTVGHMGIVVKNDEGPLEFIHATSGKAYSVVITKLERYYRSRFVKVIRVFPS
jgi:cell wall-associated NlpC family hydrolase